MGLELGVTPRQARAGNVHFRIEYSCKPYNPKCQGWRRDGGTLHAACSCGFDFGEDCSFFSTSIFSTGSVGANQAKCMSLYFRLSM